MQNAGETCVGLTIFSILLLLPTCTVQALNESASRLFCSGEEGKVEEGVAVMDEAVIPCLQLMSRDLALSQEDRDAMESIRSHWCCCLGQDMDGTTGYSNKSADHIIQFFLLFFQFF